MARVMLAVTEWVRLVDRECEVRCALRFGCCSSSIPFDEIEPGGPHRRGVMSARSVEGRVAYAWRDIQRLGPVWKVPCSPPCDATC